MTELEAYNATRNEIVDQMDTLIYRVWTMGWKKGWDSGWDSSKRDSERRRERELALASPIGKDE